MPSPSQDSRALVHVCSPMAATSTSQCDVPISVDKSLPKSTAGACSCRCMLLFTSFTFLLVCVQFEAAAAFSEAAVPAAPRASISSAGTGRLQQRRTGAQGEGSKAQRAVTNAQHKWFSRQMLNGTVGSCSRRRCRSHLGSRRCRRRDLASMTTPSASTAEHAW